MDFEHLPVWVTIGLAIGSAIGLWKSAAEFLARRFSSGQAAAERERLATDFVLLTAFDEQKAAVKRDLIGISEKVTATMSVAQLAATNADTALDKVREMEIRVAAQWDRMTERLEGTAKLLDRVTERVERISIRQARMEGAADRLNEED